LQVLFTQPVQGGQIEHVIRFPVLATCGVIDIPDAVKARIVCHVLLTQIPDEGMTEALESLGQMWEFYRTPVRQPPPLPAPTSKPAVRGRSYTREPFRVTED
jgi:hypothetical protein